MLCLVSLVHRVPHAEASHPAVQIRVPSEKWLHCHLSSVGQALCRSAAPTLQLKMTGGRPGLFVFFLHELFVYFGFNPLLVASFANILSHSVGFLFILFMVSFAVQKLLSLNMHI